MSFKPFVSEHAPPSTVRGSSTLSSEALAVEDEEAMGPALLTGRLRRPKGTAKKISPIEAEIPRSCKDE
eukprot:12375170-Prorocentrum_lima.AAC.1